MFGRIINFIIKPLIDSQTTGNYAFQQYNGYAPSDYRGNGGINFKSAVSPIYPAGIAPGPTHRVTDPFVTGNVNTDVGLQPLTDDRNV